MKELEGKNILVTGSSSGIGAGTADVLARYGANVVVNHRKSPEKAEAVARRVRELGGKAFVIQADVTDHEQVKQMVDQVLQAWHRVDVFVGNVGHSHFKRIDELKPGAKGLRGGSSRRRGPGLRLHQLRYVVPRRW